MQWATKTDYLNWDKKLRTGLVFRYFWQFWANYSFVLFAPVFLLIAQRADAIAVFHLVAVSFFFARIILVPLVCAFVKRSRPYQQYKMKPITSHFFSEETTERNSFPSRHMSAYAPIAFVIALADPTLGMFLLGVVLITGLARVILGFHHPADIIGGILLGAVTASVAYLSLATPLFTLSREIGMIVQYLLSFLV